MNWKTEGIKLGAVAAMAVVLFGLERYSILKLLP